MKAEVVEMRSFSAHADHDDLMEFAGNFNKSRLRNIFLVHGEADGQQVLTQSLAQNGLKNFISPKKGDRFNI